MAELESEPRQIVPRSSEFNYYIVPSLKKKKKNNNKTKNKKWAHSVKQG